MKNIKTFEGYYKDKLKEFTDIENKIITGKEYTDDEMNKYISIGYEFSRIKEKTQDLYYNKCRRNGTEPTREGLFDFLDELDRKANRQR